MAAHTFEDLLSELDEMSGEIELDGFMQNGEEPAESDLEFDDELTGNEHLLASLT